MQAYKDIVRKILETGELKENRTGVNTIAIAGAMFEHDMKDGFPILTTKYVPFNLVASELEFFLRGITDKGWLQERNNTIWNEWCNPKIVPYDHHPSVKERMAAEMNLGPIYGYQWRNFGAPYTEYNKRPENFGHYGVDQIKNIVETLKTNPDDRRMIVSAWNPQQLNEMALPPCHYGFQVTVINGRLNLLWNQRSVDTALGLPFNIASYALLLCLLAAESKFDPGKLIGFLGDTHIYENHVYGLTEQLQRDSKILPYLQIKNFTSIFDWEYTDAALIGYEHHPTIKFEIAV